MRKSHNRRANQVAGAFFILLFLVAGLLLGTQSTLVLTRDDTGAVTASNQWRWAGRLILISRTVTNLREARMVRVSLSESERRSSALGMRSHPEEVVLIGDNQIAYPYRDDLSLIRAFLANPRKHEVVMTHPVDIRRTVSSWFLLGLALVSIVGWMVTLALGRDPLAKSVRTVKPLPPAIGTAVFLGVIALPIAFFNLGHVFFGPLAERKVDLLMTSAAANDPKGVEEAVQAGVFVDVRDGQGETPLMLAARNGALQAAQALLAAQANPDLSDIGEDNALIWAVRENHIDLVVLLLDAGADFKGADANGRTPLFLAARQGNATIVQRLLKAGADPRGADAHGWTPLVAAAASGDLVTVQTLLQAGADPRHRLKDGRRAVDLAQGKADLVRLLTVE